MLKSKTNNQNIYIITSFIIFIIFIEIIYIIFFCKELFKEKIDYILSFEGNVYVKIFSVFLFILFFLIIYYFTKYIEKEYNIFFLYTFILIILSFLLLIEIKLKTNVNFSNKTGDINEVLNNTTTGDFILFRSYNSYDIPELFFYRYLNALYSKVFFGHIGIIINNNNEPYILECTEDFFKSEITNKKKNGVIYHKAYNRINDYYGNVYICKNNIEKFIDNNDIINFMEKYKNISFLENNISCVIFIKKFLEYFNLLNIKSYFMLPYDFINKEIYNIDYKPNGNIKIINKFQKNYG